MSSGLSLLYEMHENFEGLAAHNNLQKEVAQLKQENTKLRKRTPKASEMEKLRKRCIELEELSANLTAEYSEIDALNTTLKREAEEAAVRAAKELSAAEAEINKLRDEASQAKEASAHEIQELQLQLQEMKTKIADNELERAKLQSSYVRELSEQAGSLLKLREKSDALSSQNSLLEEMSSKQKKLISSLKIEVQNLTRDRDEHIRVAKYAVESEDRARKDKEELLEELGNFDDANHLAFANCVQQLQLLNPGVVLNLRGLSTGFIVEDGKLMDLASNQEVDLTDPSIPVFDPEASLDDEEDDEEEARPEPAGVELPQDPPTAIPESIPDPKPFSCS